MADALTFEAFSALATHVHVERELWDELYPMVRDLRSLADRLNQLAPEPHREIPRHMLSGAAPEGDR
ncbi:MAG: hypothetical protein ACRDJH_11790 [Thermomicrobiales bacterium]